MCPEGLGLEQRGQTDFPPLPPGNGYILDLVIRHGETAQSCNRGRSGVAIILSPEARAAWELGGSWVRHSSNGRALTVRISVEGGKTLTVCSAYAPTSGNTSAARQAFYDDVLVQTRKIGRAHV